MEKDIARVLLGNFVSKIHKDPQSGVYRCDGLVSEEELEAFNYALELLGGKPRIQKSPSFDVPPLALNRAASDRHEPENSDIIMCLDFGTAMSKAACINQSDGSLIDMELGTSSGSTANQYGLPSSLFIASNGVVHFGPNAIAASIDEGGGRKRLDSLKQYLSQGTLGDLSKRLVDPVYNPTTIPFTQADAIQLYFGYLTDMACSELDRIGLSRYVMRRFAMPCWEEDRTAWAESELTTLLARAQILADSLHGQWTSGLQLPQIKATLEALYNISPLPNYLIDRGIAEPVASAVGRVRGEDIERGLFVVVDVGAGTTDFAAFWIIHNDQDETSKLWQVSNSVDAVAQAGDTLDGYLQTELLTRGHLQPGHPDYPFAATKLSLEIRLLKETLFRDGVVDVHLSNGTVVTLTLSDFLATSMVVGFGDLLAKRLQKVLSTIDVSFIERLASFRKVGRDIVTLVLSGGGSSLPMVRSLADGFFNIGGTTLAKVLAPQVPDWISDRYARLSNYYPQLAVAIGGSEGALPQNLDNLHGLPSPGPSRPHFEPTTIYR